MRHTRHLHQTFGGGILSPDMFGRIEDAKYQTGAAWIENMLPKPQGPLVRRPGTRLVRQTKDQATDKRVCLFPFVFNQDQTMVIEAGRYTADGRELGYFRFHTDGATLLYDKPGDFLAPQNVAQTSGTSTATSATTLTDSGAAWTVNQFAGHRIYANGGTANVVSNTSTVITVTAWTGSTPAGVSPYVIYGMCSATANEEIDLGTASTFATGDPIVLTMSPTESLTFDTATNRALVGMAFPRIVHGTPVCFAVTGGSLPTPLEPYRIYYASLPDSTGFGISLTPFGAELDLAGGSGSPTVAAMPSFLNGPAQWLPTTIGYALPGTTGTRIRIAMTAAEAVAGTYTQMLSPGLGSFRVHRAYQPGELVYDSGVFAGVACCMKRPWGDSSTGLMAPADHLGHATTDQTYWARISGAFAAVTVDPATDTVDWGSAHTFPAGTPVVLSGSGAPGGTTLGVTYYVAQPAGTTFKLAAEPYGKPIDLTTAGTSVSAFVDGIYEVPHYYTETDLQRLSIAQSNDVLSMAVATRPFAELRRLSASRWEWREVEFGAAIAPPASLYGTVFEGVGMGIVSVFAAGPPVQLNTDSKHQFTKGETVYVSGVGFGITDGDYVVEDTTAAGGVALYLQTLEGGADVTASGTGATPATARVRSSIPSANRTNTYVVTSVDAAGEESVASNELTLTNNLEVQGSYNTLSWVSVPGANRYRLYKKQGGLYGLIAETDTTTFRDDSIAPELSITTPIRDDGLRVRASVTFDLTNDRVTWADHPLANGAPVVFDTDDALPSGIEAGVTYYATDVQDGSFALLEEPLDDVTINLTNSPRAPAGNAWAVGGAFPGSVCYFEQRRILGGSIQFPQDVWATASGTESDMSYSIPVTDSDRIYFRIAAREANQVRHMVPLGHLLLLASNSELRVTPVNDDALTPTSVSVRPQSYIGADYAQPQTINNVVVYAAARGGHLREMGYAENVGGYVTGDLSLRATDLFDGKTIVQIAYQRAPFPVVWVVTSDGDLLSLTYLPEEQIGAWATHTVAGSSNVESVCVVPEGIEDRVYVVTEDGGSRYVERMGPWIVNGGLADSYFVDRGVTYDGAPTTTIAVEHLDGETVTYLADGLSGTGVVANGVLTLPTAASVVHAGIGYASWLDTLPFWLSVPGYGTGSPKSVTKVYARVRNSGSFTVAPLGKPSAPSRKPDAGLLHTGMVAVVNPAAWTDDGQVRIMSDGALPLEVVGLTLEVAVGG